MSETFTFDGRAVPFRAGQSIGAALWQNGVRAFRRTRGAGAPRGLFCGIGVCHDCLVVVDGQPDQRACLTPAQPGALVGTQIGQPAPPMPDLLGESDPPDAVSARAAPRLVADVVVVGAGPAGLSSAVAAERLGASVILLDSEERPGGQYWRHGPSGVGAHHHRVEAWRALRSEFADARERALSYLPRHRVWRVDRLDGNGFRLDAVRPVGGGPDGAEVAVEVRGRAVVMATGAHDRLRPFPGWDLPGVLTAGGAQALLKEHDVVAGRRVVVAGTGPFLLSLAADLARAGAEVVAVCEAGDGSGWLRRWRSAAALPELVAEGAQYVVTLSRHRVPVRPRHLVLAARGRDRVEAVEVARLDRHGRVVAGSQRRLACDTLATGWGFVPRLELAQQAGCPVGTSVTIGPAAGAAVPADLEGRTAVPGVFVAGEVAGVGGAPLAQLTGALAGGAAASFALGVPVAPDGAALVRVRRLGSFAAAMHAAHQIPPAWLDALTEETTVCRCEEVVVRSVRNAVREFGAGDPRTVKLLTRCGMGWCQGRICGQSVAALLPQLTGRAGPPGDLAAPDPRPVASPVLLSTLASIADQDEGELS